MFAAQKNELNKMKEKLYFLHSPDTGKLILRLVIGIVLILHGLAKIQNGVGGTMGMIQSRGFPGWITYGAYIGEVLAPLLLIIGKYTRPAGLVVAFTMLMAMIIAYPNAFFQRGQTGGLLVEVNYLILFGGLAITFLGAGKFSLSKGNGPLD